MRKILAILLSLVCVLALAAPALADVTPDTVTGSLAPGDSLTPITKTVTTPVIPPNPDIMFLADTTGSMGPALANVQANIAAILTAVLAAQPTAQFGAAQYKDFVDPFAYQLDQAITSNTANVIAAVNTWTAAGGGDTPEAQLYALDQIATTAVGFRPGSTRIIVWFGDSSGHDPSGGISLAQAIADLQTGANSPISVIAIPVVSGAGDGLDATGQASAITSATSGVLLPGAAPADVANAILAGLSALPITVSWTVDPIDTGLSVSLTPASQTVQSGDDATFTETISVAADAPQCDTLNATVTFADENGNVLGVETIAIYVLDITPPLVSSTETVNPAGKKTPPAGSTTMPGPKGGMNEDGFYVLTATDNCDPNPLIYVTDASGSVVFGPFSSGTVVKFTEAPGASPQQKTMGGPGSAVQWHITLPTDAEVFAVDASGNLSSEIQYVPPLPK